MTEQKIKAIILDCFGVFYVDPGLYFYSRNVPHYEEVREQIMEIDRAFDQGYLSMSEHDHAVADLTGLSYKQVHEEVRKPLARNQDMIDFVRRLRKTHKVAMLSNVGRGGMMERFFSKKEQQDLFDVVQLSYESGFVKPERGAFELVAQRLGVLPQECVMVDDREVNCEAAVRAGMRAVRYNSFGQFKQEIKTLI